LLACERWPRDVAAEPLEASPVARGDGDFGVEVDAIAQASPWLAAMGAGRERYASKRAA
jgi:hypothetical protein